MKLSLHFHKQFCCCCSVIMSCPILCNPVDYSPPGSSVHGISQTRILEWVAIFLSPGALPDPGTEPTSSALAGIFFTTEPPGRPTWNNIAYFFCSILCLWHLPMLVVKFYQSFVLFSLINCFFLLSSIVWICTLYIFFICVSLGPLWTFLCLWWTCVLIYGYLLRSEISRS